MATQLYVACWLTPIQAARIAVPRGEAAADMHLTLLCLGDPDQLGADNVAKARRIVADWAATCAPIAGQVSGVGRFMGATQDVLYASVDAPTLSCARETLCMALCAAGIDPDDTHGFDPHITLAYLAPGESIDPYVDPDNDGDIHLPLPLPIMFDTVAIVSPDTPHAAGDDLPFGIRKAAVEDQLAQVADRVAPEGGYGGVAWHPATRTVFWQSADWTTADEHAAARQAFLAIPGVTKVTGEAEAAVPDWAGWQVIRKEQPSSDAVHVDTASGDISVGIDPATGKKRKRKRRVELVKADADHRIVYGVVLQPKVEDAQGDVMSPEQIELAAHRYLYQRNPIGDQHGRMAPDAVRAVESYIAPCDFEMGGQTVKKGSWVLVAHVPDDDLWEQIKKGYKGAWSVGGTGKRRPL